jgi:phage terminase large subunit-like protein
MTTNGMIIFTFTPLMGLTDIIRDFLRMDHEQEESNG